jgi:hypothetical protein
MWRGKRCRQSLLAVTVAGFAVLGGLSRAEALSVGPWLAAPGGPAVSPRIIPVQNRLASSPLKRRDTPPPTIRPALMSKDPASGAQVDCVVSRQVERHQTRATPSECGAEITDTLSLEFPDLDDGSIEVVIRAPDGSVGRFTTDRVLEFYLAAGMPLGAYAVNASDGANSSRGGYTVRPARSRIVKVASETPVFAPGQSIPVDLAGYRPGETVRLYLYRKVGHREVGTGQTDWEYAAAIGEVRINGRGETSITIPTEPDDPAGEYRIMSDPRQDDHETLPETFTVRE